MDTPLFRQEVIKHQRERLWGDVVLALPVSFLWITAFLLSCTVASGLFLSLGNYQRKQEVPGILSADRGVVPVIPPRPGRLVTLQASEGKRVAKGELLFTLRIDERFTDGHYLSDRLLEGSKRQQKLLEEQLELEELALAARLRRQGQHSTRLKDEILHLESLVETQKNLLALNRAASRRGRSLHRKGVMPRSELDQLRMRVLEGKKVLENTLVSLENARHERDGLALERETLRVQSEESRLEIRQRLTEIDIQHARTRGDRLNSVKAPISGRISSLVVNVGQQVQGERVLFSIVPEDARLQAQLYVPARSAGFLETGQTVNLRYDAFPYQRFGHYQGEISEIARSVLAPGDASSLLQLGEPTYKVTVTLARQTVQAYGEAVHLKTGMSLSADVILDERSLLEWLFDPILSLRGKW